MARNFYHYKGRICKYIRQATKQDKDILREINKLACKLDDRRLQRRRDEIKKQETIEQEITQKQIERVTPERIALLVAEILRQQTQKDTEKYGLKGLNKYTQKQEYQKQYYKKNKQRWQKYRKNYILKHQ